MANRQMLVMKVGRTDTFTHERKNLSPGTDNTSSFDVAKTPITLCPVEIHPDGRYEWDDSIRYTLWTSDSLLVAAASASHQWTAKGSVPTEWVLAVTVDFELQAKQGEIPALKPNTWTTADGETRTTMESPIDFTGEPDFAFVKRPVSRHRGNLADAIATHGIALPEVARTFAPSTVVPEKPFG